jgi:hypothetical protein
LITKMGGAFKQDSKYWFGVGQTVAATAITGLR